MPIKKHVVKIVKKDKKNILEIPESICSALGINTDSVVKVYSNNNGYSFTVESMLSYENVCLLEQLRQQNEDLKNMNLDLTNKLKKYEQENN